MKKLFMMSVLGLAMATSVQAQVVSKDSMSMLKQEKENLEIGKRLNGNKIKLAKLENSVKEATDKVNSTADDAQKAAKDNQETAQKLNGDSQDKKLARRARSDSKNAQRKATAARGASDDLADLQKDIESLKKKIAEDETTLGTTTAMPVM